MESDATGRYSMCSSLKTSTYRRLPQLNARVRSQLRCTRIRATRNWATRSDYLGVGHYDVCRSGSVSSGQETEKIFS